MRKKIYHCEDCNFNSSKLSLFKRHLNTANHLKKSHIVLEKIQNFEKFKIEMYC